MHEDSLKSNLLFVSYKTESKGSEEAVAIASNLSVRVDVPIHRFLQLGLDLFVQLVQFFADHSCNRDGFDWVLDCF